MSLYRWLSAHLLPFRSHSIMLLGTPAIIAILLLQNPFKKTAKIAQSPGSFHSAYHLIACLLYHCNVEPPFSSVVNAKDGKHIRYVSFPPDLLLRQPGTNSKMQFKTGNNPWRLLTHSDFQTTERIAKTFGVASLTSGIQVSSQAQEVKEREHWKFSEDVTSYHSQAATQPKSQKKLTKSAGTS